jgi:diguanylate cyclase (GGDEF)-like protein
MMLQAFTSTPALAIVAAICLVTVGTGVLLRGRRLRAGRQARAALPNRDELAGVGGSRSLRERLAEEIARHSRHAQGFALVLFDFDGLRAVNDPRRGLDGDRLLAEVGAALGEEIRAEDAVFRPSGDELALIVPEASTERAEEVAARLRGRVGRRNFGGDLRRPAHASTGFAMYPADGRSVEDLLGFADLALFAAKRERAV